MGNNAFSSFLHVKEFKLPLNASGAKQKKERVKVNVDPSHQVLLAA